MYFYSLPEQTVEGIVDLPVTWDAMTSMWRHCHDILWKKKDSYHSWLNEVWKDIHPVPFSLIYGAHCGLYCVWFAWYLGKWLLLSGEKCLFCYVFITSAIPVLLLGWITFKNIQTIQISYLLGGISTKSGRKHLLSPTICLRILQHVKTKWHWFKTVIDMWNLSKILKAPTTPHICPPQKNYSLSGSLSVASTLGNF